MPQTQSIYSMPRIIANALIRKKAPIEDFKPNTIQIENYYCDSKKLYGFEQAFRHPNEMASFSFIATFKLIMQCISQSNIPSNLMGLIHLQSTFKTENRQNWLAPTDISVTLEEAKETDKGRIYTVTTRLQQANETTVTNTNVFLDKKKGYKPAKSETDEVSKNESNNLSKPLSQVALSLKTAWRYARLSGDYNPIHLHSFLAKKFGLKDALIHGMFNAHFAINEILKVDHGGTKEVIVQFNKPCFLPNQAYLKQYGDSHVFGLFSIDGKDRFLKVELKED